MADGAGKADLEWREDDVPASRRFDDVYYAATDGLAESRHVFLAGNGLPDAWRGRDRFVVAETGFGTGLNFLALWDLWRRHGPAGGRLHYLSAEAYPLTPEETARALARWPELAPLARDLVDRLPAPHPGFHRLFLDGGRVTLTLLVGEVLDVLREVEPAGVVDAWFLDGFAPARNPAMWRPEVLAEVARLARPGTTLASFTAAGAVRRGLADVGFEVEKRRGFGAKRDMTVARVPGDTKATPPRVDRPVRIVGAGIAGCAVAHALRRRGIEATIVDRHGRAAAEASGNPLGLVMPRLDIGGRPAARFSVEAWRFCRMILAALGVPVEAGAGDTALDGDGDGDGGVLMPLDTEAKVTRIKKAIDRRVLPAGSLSLLDPVEASRRAGVTLDQPAAWFAGAGLIEPAAFCDRLLDGLAVGRPGEFTALGEPAAEVFAIGAHAGGLGLPIEPVRGQLSLVPETVDSRRLACPVVWGGYLAPARDGRHLLGATHERGPVDLGPVDLELVDLELGDLELVSHPATAAAHLQNLDRAPDALRRLLDPAIERWDGRTSVRATVPDRMPLVGEWSGRWVLTGLGSRGLVTAPLAAELLVSRLLGEPWPIERSLAAAVDVARYAAPESAPVS